MTIQTSSELIKKIEQAAQDNQLLEGTQKHLKEWLQEGFLPAWAVDAIQELIDKKAWEELNDRFYKTLEFGTGGMRGRTMGKVSTVSEVGQPSAVGTPEHPAVGTSYLNDFNIIKATIGLFRYSQKYVQEQGDGGSPKLVIAHDVRHFSRHFCLLAASTWTQLGGTVYIFDGPRSTPQLSFSVRHLKATAGIVITASHNPPHDNGYKVYFNDGAQIVSPHAESVISEFKNVALTDIPAFLEVKEEGIHLLTPDVDEAYKKALDENITDASLLKSSTPKVVFSSIHGVGQVMSIPVLKQYGVDVIEVPEQQVMDPRFPTVKSPNPENAEALSMAIKKANEVSADVVLATDPDADRMGAAVRDNSGQMILITGNIIGCLLAEYRIRQFKAKGLLSKEGSKAATVIKTFVTTPLLDAIGEGHGLKVINTLTGFKWIGEKIKSYEDKLMKSYTEKAYDDLSLSERSKLLQEMSTFFVFGTEESYGYLGSDKVRDKDANAAVLMFCELVAYLKKKGQSVLEFLDELYAQYGYHLEDQLNIYYEGAAGSQKIKNILNTYRDNPPQVLGGIKVASFKDFGRETILDADDQKIPPQDFYFLELENGYRYAVRGSGTEPKIKFYIFAKELVSAPDNLQTVKHKTTEVVQALKQSIEQDARKRAETHG